MAAQISVPHVPCPGEQDTNTVVDLSRFRVVFYDCLTARADALFELADAVLCEQGPVNTLVELCLAAQHRRGHGALYDGLNAGRIDITRLSYSLSGLPLPRDRDGRIVLAVDVSNWLRPDADTSAERLFCHTYGRGKNQAQMIPGWPYSFVAVLESGPSSWTQILDVVRLGPTDDETEATARQVRDVVTRLVQARQWQPGDPDILIVFDAGYDVTRLAYLLDDLPVQLVGRLRSDRVLRHPKPPRTPGAGGRPPKHGPEFSLPDPDTWTPPDVATANDTPRYGTATASCWNRLHPRLTRRAAWTGHEGELPVTEGSLIRLSVDHLPGERDPKPLWLWTSSTNLSAETVDRAWRAFLRRFDLEHTFRMLKQTLGWTKPKIRHPEAADRWTWLIVVAYTQLRLARDRTDHIRRPWEPRQPAGRPLTPAQVHRGYRNIHRKLPVPARAPKPSRPGPGRPPGRKNRQQAPRHNVGKHTNQPHDERTRG
nr:NF041680 family putative transposase [Actinopolymorpha pittospori]